MTWVGVERGVTVSVGGTTGVPAGVGLAGSISPVAAGSGDGGPVLSGLLVGVAPGLVAVGAGGVDLLVLGVGVSVGRLRRWTTAWPVAASPDTFKYTEAPINVPPKRPSPMPSRAKIILSRKSTLTMSVYPLEIE